jgi:malate dehydrogenase (oxaloacetate-decarboxylating)
MSTSKDIQQQVKKRGHDLIRDPLLNKGTALTREERKALGVEGLLPHRVMTMEGQARRVYEALQGKSTPLGKYVDLADLQERNEQLYYRVLADHLEELMPIVYTPTVGLATQRYSHVYRRGRGIWITPDHRGKIAQVIRDAVGDRDIRLMVVTDNEAILGIGDQGAGGMALAIGKLALYCAAAGIHPRHTLPVSLDVGTNNELLLEDDMYVGYPGRRLRGKEYDELVQEFVEAVVEVLPGAVVQWEDLRKDNALKILDRYRNQVPSFNDDIQGTGAVVLAGTISAMRISGKDITDQRVLVYGAGAAGLGIVRQVRGAIVEAGGLPTQVGVMDSRGLLVSDQDFPEAYKRDLAMPLELAQELGMGNPEDRRTLLDVVRFFKPTVLVGASGQPRSFNEEVVKEMARHVKRPVILPISNPTDLSEAVPAEVLEWTDGQALVATGSPFPPVQYGGREYEIGQCNNVFIFPGVGMGALLAGCATISSGMVRSAAYALAQNVSQEELDAGMLFPEVSRLREISRKVAEAVMRVAAEEGIGEKMTDEERIQRLNDFIWEPGYSEYVPA